MKARQATFNDYDGFVEKFKPKKTTDDCYTPPAVYETIKNWACSEYGIDPSKVVRPFYPGGDYESFDYSGGKVVVDNPPFVPSIRAATTRVSTIPAARWWWTIRRSRFCRRYARSTVTTIFPSSCSLRTSRFSAARHATAHICWSLIAISNTQTALSSKQAS